MAGREREVKVTVLGDTKPGQRALAELDDRADKTGRHFDGLGGKLATFGKVAALGLAGAAVGAGVFLKKSIEAAEESRKVAAQTEAVIKSTGGAAKVTAAQVDDLASSLSAMSAVDDEVIATGANMLLTFTRIRNEVGKGNDIFDQATKAALDMSVALGTDMQSASMLVGKALNDPIRGMTALTRSGIQFTQQQKDQVKAMVESGNILGAQKIILKELETQFGGSAAAAASPMERLKVVVGNLQEELGARLLPVVGKVAGLLADKLPGALDAVGRALQPVLVGVRAFGSAFSGEGITSDGFVGVMERIGVAAREVWDNVREAWPQIKATIMGAVEAIVGWVREHWPEIKKIIVETVETVQKVVSGVVEVLTTIWENFGEQITDVVKAAWKFVRDTIEGALKVVQGIVKTITSLIKGDWSGVWEGIKQILAGAWDMIQARIELGLNLIKNIISAGLEIVKAVFSDAWNAVFEVTRNVLAVLVDVWLATADTIISAAAKAFGWIPGIGDKLRQAADWFHEFRENANNAIRGIDANVAITADSSQFWAEYNRVASAARIATAIELQPLGYDTAGPQMRHEGLSMGPLRGAPGQEVMVRAKAGEWVATPEQMAALVSGRSGGSSAAVVVNISIGTLAGSDGMHQLAETIRSELLKYQRRVPGLGYE
jgi:hypothetical protein